MNEEEQEQEQEYAIRPNKEQLKRDLKDLHYLGRELVLLPKSHFSVLPLSEHAKDQIFAAKKFKKSALQRQLRFIAGLLQEEKVDEIREALRLIKLPHKKDVEQFHQLEVWRDQLIAGDNAVLEDIMGRYSLADRQYIRQLIRNATREIAKNQTPKASRMLFKYLQQLHQD
jgi:ribosome-associated protein